MNVDTTTCDVCGAALKHLFTSSYCPNDCDKFPPFQAEDDTKPMIGRGNIVKEVLEHYPDFAELLFGDG